MYIIKAHGGRWEDVWETCLFAVNDELVAQTLLEAFQATKAAYVEAHKIFQEKESEFKLAWITVNPRPVVVKLPRSKKPKHPEPDVSLRGMSKKDKKELPLQKLYLKQLSEYATNTANWEKEERDLFEKEYAETHAWEKRYVTATTAFTEAEFKPLNLIPEPWKERASKYLSYACSSDTEDHFSIEQIDVFE